MCSADGLGKGGTDVENNQLGAKGALLNGDRVGVGDDNLVDVRALLNLAQRVSAEDTVRRDNVHLLGSVTDQVVCCLQERVASVNHIILIIMSIVGKEARRSVNTCMNLVTLALLSPLSNAHIDNKLALSK